MNQKAIGVPGIPGLPGLPLNFPGEPGGDGGDAAVVVNAPTDTSNTAMAIGGRGGVGGLGGIPSGTGGEGGTGGNGQAVSITTAADPATTHATAIARGGKGGKGGTTGLDGGLINIGGGPGGDGGNASGNASAVNLSGAASASVVVTGGDGGEGGAGPEQGSGGSGGSAGGTSIAIGRDAATAALLARGGNGASSDNYYAGGGSGGSIFLDNSVSGSTSRGTLTLDQTAVGGDGGDSIEFGGLGGYAASNLAVDDSASVTPSQTIIATVEAVGGQGTRYGGDARATADIAGVAVVEVTAQAEGGSSAITAGSAVATAMGSGNDVDSTARASSHGSTGTQATEAMAQAYGHAGTVRAIADFGVSHGLSFTIPETLRTSAATSVLGTSAADAAAQSGYTLIRDTTSQAVSRGVVGPGMTTPTDLPDQRPVDLDAELGGGAQAAPGAIAASTSLLSASYGVRAPLDHPLLVDLYSATLVGTGVIGVDFTLSSGATVILHESFARGAEAAAFFTHHLIGTGFTVDEDNAGEGLLPLGMSMTVTTDDPSSGFYAEIQAGTACYRAGTRIMTERGPRVVEALAIGDRVRTLSGALEPITWIGHRFVDCTRHPAPRRVWPVRVREDAFGAGAPQAELWLSPDHAVFAEGVLIPIHALANGTTIAQVPFDRVDYFHIELAAHNVILAEGLPCETYLDTGNRTAFANGGAAVALHPEFSALAWETLAYAPLCVAGRGMDAVRATVAMAAETCGYVKTSRHKVTSPGP